MKTIEMILEAIENKKVTFEAENGKPIEAEETETFIREAVKAENKARKAESLKASPVFSAESVYNALRVKKDPKTGAVDIIEYSKLMSIADYVKQDKKTEYKKAVEHLNNTLKLYVASGFNFATVSKASIKKAMTSVMRCVYNEAETLAECNAFDVNFLTYYSTSKGKAFGSIAVKRAVDAMSIIAYCRATECSYTVEGVILLDGKPIIEPPEDKKE